MSELNLHETTELVAFAALGTLSATQELAGRVTGSIEGADAELVAEETLCMVATATARATEVGLREGPGNVAEAVCDSLMALPFTYRDYLVGSAMVEEEDPSLTEAGEEAGERLERKQRFYTTHLPPGQFPGPHALQDKMALWMGRVSPPRLPEMPQERLEKLKLVPRLTTHCKLVLAAARRKVG